MEQARQGDVLWAGTCRSRFAIPTAVAVVGAGALAAIANPVVGGFVAAAGLAVLPLVSVTVEVTPEVLRCRFAGPGGWPTVSIPVAEIEGAEVIDVRPLRYGGWGYRGSLRLFRRAAVTLRSGPGLRLALTGGRVFVVTVDGPQGALAHLPTAAPAPEPAR